MVERGWLLGKNEVNLQDAVVRTRNTFLKWKRLHHLVTSPECLHAYRTASDEERKKFNGFVENGKEDDMKNWVAYHSQTKLEYWSYRKLRERGKELSIPRWSRLEKHQLISAIREKEEKCAKVSTK